MDTPVEILVSTTCMNQNMDIRLNDSIEKYKYLEIQCDAHDRSLTNNLIGHTIFVIIEQYRYNNSNTVSWEDDSTVEIILFGIGSPICYMGSTCWFKNDQILHVGDSATNRPDWDKLRIRKIYGIQ